MTKTAWISRDGARCEQCNAPAGYIEAADVIDRAGNTQELFVCSCCKERNATRQLQRQPQE